jgi:membrane AbrB-like protein
LEEDPFGPLIVPMVAGSILHASGVVEIELPRWLLVGTFAVLGWGIGIQFTRCGLAHAARSFPLILASIAVLIVFCVAVALLLHRVVGTDLLTAYLATSPGGLDAAAVIAASTNVDSPLSWDCRPSV